MMAGLILKILFWSIASGILHNFLYFRWRSSLSLPCFWLPSAANLGSTPSDSLGVVDPADPHLAPPPALPLSGLPPQLPLLLVEPAHVTKVSMFPPNIFHGREPVTIVPAMVWELHLWKPKLRLAPLTIWFVPWNISGLVEVLTMEDVLLAGPMVPHQPQIGHQLAGKMFSNTFMYCLGMKLWNCEFINL